MNKVLALSGLQEIYEKYDTFILDQWGVMHNGVKGYLNAIECINTLFHHKKDLIIISNSSKRKNTTVDRLPDLGFKNFYFAEVMTSGEMMWQSLLNSNLKSFDILGNNCFHIFNQNTENPSTFTTGLEKFNFVEKINDADFILGCTPFKKKSVLDYLPYLEIAKNKNIPFLCANPDFDVFNSNLNENTFCMGTISELYKNMGGKVFTLGKPNAEIYNVGLKKINTNKARILAIGDSIYHDILGANKFKIDSLLITSTGIHSGIFDKKNPDWECISNNFKNNDIKPTFICSELIF